MNIAFFINGETVAVGRKTREYFSNIIKESEKAPGEVNSMSNPNGIKDDSDNGIEWELCESLGVNPGRYVDRISFYMYCIEKDSRNSNTWEVKISAKMA